MIITKTPLRVSFVGGGSDIENHYRKYSGSVISSAINQYVYITVKKKFDSGIRFSYSSTENVNHYSELKHELCKQILDRYKPKHGIELVSISDIPSKGTGLGSSSTFAVGLINALSKYNNKLLSPREIAEAACDTEINRCKSPIGKQDQYIAALGGFRKINFHTDGSVTSEVLPISSDTYEKLNNELLYFYLGGYRSTNLILSDQTSAKDKNKKTQLLQEMTKLTMPLSDALMSGATSEIGGILHENWLMKKSLSKLISSNEIDEIYEQGRSLGATGGKLLGAGGGGFMMFYAPNQGVKKRLLQEFSNLKRCDFSLNQAGSTVVYHENE